MSAVSEAIVREYFEAQGFLVHEPRKYAVAARKKLATEEIDLLVHKPSAVRRAAPKTVLWTGADLDGVGRAVVSIRGWHTDRFSPAVLKLSPEIFRFTHERAVKNAADVLGKGEISRILCLPDLPASQKSKEDALAMLKEHGVDGVLLFRTMLMELCEYVDVRKSYERSDLLQTVRILKNYDLLKDPQMELFKRRPRRKS